MPQRRHIDGSLVRELRELRGQDGKTFAANLSISESYLWRIETGERRPRPPVIAEIAAALGVTVAHITRPADAEDAA